jgi:hypothetical protein
MQWVIWILAALALLIAIAAVIGAMLPRAHSATRTARFRVAPDALYAVLSGPPDWRTGVKGYGVLPDQDGRKRWWEEDTFRHKIIFELIEDRPPERIAVRIAEPNLPFGGAWTFDITPAPGGGSDLRIREDGEIHNVIFRFLAHFVFGYTRSIETYLNDLATKFGERARTTMEPWPPPRI